MILKKIFFDEQGNVGTIIGSDILPLKENERMICSEQEALALGLADGQWMTLEALRGLPNNHAIIAYEEISKFDN